MNQQTQMIPQQPRNSSSIQQFFSQGMVQDELQKILGQNAASFSASVIQIVNNNNALQNVNPVSIFGAAMTAATLNLPINNNLGFAYIVPFKSQAQFQIGYKGFIQLAQRTGQFRRINASPIYAGDTEQDVYQRLTSFIPKPPSGSITGYIAFFELLNGFQAHFAMTAQEMQAHAKKYSQSYKNGGGIWKTNFDEMAKKTVIKLLLSKQAPLSIDSQITTAVQADQAVILDGQYRYVDNEPYLEQQPVMQDIPCYDINPLLTQISAIETMDQVRAMGQSIKALSENPKVNLCGDDLSTLRNALTNKKSELQANALESVWSHEATAFTDKQMTEQAIDSVATPVSDESLLDQAKALESELTKAINVMTLEDTNDVKFFLEQSRDKVAEITYTVLESTFNNKFAELEAAQA